MSTVSDVQRDPPTAPTHPDRPRGGRSGDRRDRGDRWALVGYVVIPALLLGQVAVRVSPMAEADPMLPVTTFSLVFALIALIGTGYAIRAAWHPRLTRAARRPWLFMVPFFALILIGGYMVGTAMRETDPNMATLSPLLVAGLSTRVIQVFLIVGAMMSFAATRLDRRGRAKLVLDVLTVMGGAFMPLWYVILGPMFEDEQRIRTGLLAYCVTFSLCDLGAIVAMSTVLLRGPAAAVRRPLILLLAGNIAYLVNDIWFIGMMINHDMYVPGVTSDLTMALPEFVMVAAAIERCRTAGRSDAAEVVDNTASARPPSVLPYLALLVGHGVLVAAALDSTFYPWFGLILTSVVMNTGVAIRQVVALRENHALLLTDSLTGIANRARVHTALDRAIASYRRTGRPVAVLAIDLNGFKQINDTYGHDAGDMLLEDFAHTLRRSVRATDTPARVGGDEFVVILDGVPDAQAAISVAERIRAFSERPVPIGGESVVAQASIGIALPDDPESATLRDDLLRNADLAMYAAKRDRIQGRGWVLHKPPDADCPVVAEQERADLLRAISTGELDVHYQPIVALITGELMAVEALVRWRHPTRGLLTPADFLEAAERTGLIHDLDMWVLERASRQVRTWQDRLPPGRTLSLSVNLSSRQASSPALVADMEAVLNRTGLDPRTLIVEVADSGGPDMEDAVGQLTALRERGVRVALDGFGTGYASLQRLSRLPVDILKLDRSFVSGLPSDPERATVAEAVIRIGQMLRLDTVAKGIEEADQATELTLLGCDKAQGYHFAQPLPPEEMDVLVSGSVLEWPHLPQPTVPAALAR